MSPNLLTRAEVAQILRCSLRSVDRLRKRGYLPAVRVFKSVRFREEDVLAFINSEQRAGQ